MILTGQEIKNRLKKGDIIITPFSEDNLNPNSYNLTLNKKLLTYKDPIIATNKKNEVNEIIIPETGFVLNPGTVYLAQTNEYTETRNLVPVLYGRSSIGRLGLFVHVTAGYGDTGFCGNWTLELAAVQPIKIFPNIKICQIIYQSILGEQTEYNGKYQNAKIAEASKLYLDK